MCALPILSRDIDRYTSTYLQIMYVCMYVRMYVCNHIHTYIRTYIHTCIDLAFQNHRFPCRGSHSSLQRACLSDGNQGGPSRSGLRGLGFFFQDLGIQCACRKVESVSCDAGDAFPAGPKQRPRTLQRGLAPSFGASDCCCLHLSIPLSICYVGQAI